MERDPNVVPERKENEKKQADKACEVRSCRSHNYQLPHRKSFKASQGSSTKVLRIHHLTDYRIENPLTYHKEAVPKS